MSVVAPAPESPARPRRGADESSTPRRKPRRTAAMARPRGNRSPVAPAVAWVLLLTVLFGGIVALNVGALRNSVDASRSEGQAAALRSQNAELQVLVSQRSDYRRISMMAAQFGMVHSQPPRSDFLRLNPPPARHRPAVKATATQHAHAGAP